MDIASRTATYFLGMRHQSMSIDNQSPIMICEVIHEERFIRVLFNGDAIVGYSVFYKWAEAHLHEVALIRIGDAIDWESYDPLQVELMQDAFSMWSRSEYYQKQEQRLVHKFLDKVVISHYTDESIKRLISMCRLGADPRNVEHVAMLHMARCVTGDTNAMDYMWWVNGIWDCYTVGRSPADYVDGCNLLARVLGHLVYLEEMNPTSPKVRRAERGKGLQRMSLFKQ